MLEEKKSCRLCNLCLAATGYDNRFLRNTPRQTISKIIIMIVMIVLMIIFQAV